MSKETAAEKVGQKLGEVVAEKGAEKIKQILRKRSNPRPKQTHQNPPSDAEFLQTNFEYFFL